MRGSERCASNECKTASSDWLPGQGAYRARSGRSVGRDIRATLPVAFSAALRPARPRWPVGSLAARKGCKDFATVTSMPVTQLFKALTFIFSLVRCWRALDCCARRAAREYVRPWPGHSARVAGGCTGSKTRTRPVHSLLVARHCCRSICRFHVSMS